MCTLSSPLLPCTPLPSETLAVKSTASVVPREAIEQLPATPALCQKLEDLLDGHGAGQLHTVEPYTTALCTRGDMRLVSQAAKLLCTEKKSLFGTAARGKERGVALLAAEVLGAERPSDKLAVSEGGNILARVRELEKKEKDLMAASRKASHRTSAKLGTEGQATILVQATEELVTLTELWGSQHTHGFETRAGGKRRREQEAAADAQHESRPKTRQLVQEGGKLDGAEQPFQIRSDMQFDAEVRERVTQALGEPTLLRQQERTRFKVAAEQLTEEHFVEADQRASEAFSSGLDAGRKMERAAVQQEIEEARAVQKDFVQQTEDVDRLHLVVRHLQDALEIGHDAWDHAEYEAVKHGGFAGWDGVHKPQHINGEQFQLTSYVCAEGGNEGLRYAVHDCRYMRALSQMGIAELMQSAEQKTWEWDSESDSD